MPVITDDEFRRNGRDASDPLAAAVYYAMGAASVCWEDLAEAGTFDSIRAAEIADDLTTYLRKTYGLVSKTDLAWLEVLIGNAKPRYPGDPQRDWEGAGRANAKRILATAQMAGSTRRKPLKATSASEQYGVTRGQDRVARNR